MLSVHSTCPKPLKYDMLDFTNFGFLQLSATYLTVGIWEEAN